MKNETQILRTLSVAFAASLLILAMPRADAQRGGPAGPPFMVTTTAFADGGIVPEKYAARGENLQPGFTFSNVPANAVSIAVIFHDIEPAFPQGSTGDILHWMAWNIPAAAGAIPEGSLPAGAVSGNNIRNQPGYMGPGAPATERYHHYVFEFYALNANLDLPATATRQELLAAMEGKVVGKVAYVGRYRGLPQAAAPAGAAPTAPR
jgi:Raf kinase inhibitor-like YbhB/YbcL family protein